MGSSAAFVVTVALGEAVVGLGVSVSSGLEGSSPDEGSTCTFAIASPPGVGVAVGEGGFGVEVGAGAGCCCVEQPNTKATNTLINTICFIYPIYEL